ncbi:hypothetical protein AB0N09_43915, partial [Streptomyces erythrochromogenes]
VVQGPAHVLGDARLAPAAGEVGPPDLEAGLEDRSVLRTPRGSESSWTAAAVRARTAAAIRENSDQRIQEFQQVTWPWSSPVKPLVNWKASSFRHLRQITSTTVASETSSAAQQRK